MIEAPGGTLIHHDKVYRDDAIRWANLIVATGYNSRAISDGVRQVSEPFIKGDCLDEGRNVEPSVGAGTRLRSLAELCHSRRRRSSR
jgi:coenzyme F420-reducing hydrogenase alpha subunit